MNVVERMNWLYGTPEGRGEHARLMAEALTAAERAVIPMSSALALLPDVKNTAKEVFRRLVHMGAYADDWLGFNARCRRLYGTGQRT